MNLNMSLVLLYNQSFATDAWKYKNMRTRTSARRNYKHIRYFCGILVNLNISLPSLYGQPFAADAWKYKNTFAPAHTVIIKLYTHICGNIGNPNITLFLLCDLLLGINIDRGACERACARACKCTGILYAVKTYTVNYCIRTCQLHTSTISHSQLMLKPTHTHTQLCYIDISQSFL